VVLEWTERNKKLNVVKINRVPLQQVYSRAGEFKHRQEENEAG
jgi:hypothetical protein